MNWKRTLDIKPILYNEETSLAEKAVLMKAALLVSPFIDSLREKNLLIFITGIFDTAGEGDDVEMFDEGLEYLYDWADSEKVWLGI